MKKQGVLLSGLVLLLSLSVFGCSKQAAPASSDSGGKSTDAQATATKPPDDKAKPISAKFYYDFTAFTDYLKEINPILQKNDNVTLEPVSYNEPSSFETAVRIGFTTQDAADSFKWWNGYRMKELVDNKNLADMTAQWKDMVADGVLPSMADSLTFDGKTYGVPIGVHYWVMYYNKKVFAANNLKAPTTWDEFIAACETLKGKGIKPLGQTVTDTWNGFIWFEDLMLHSNPDFYNKLVVGKAKYTDPEAVEVMKLWKSLYDKGYFAPPMDWQKEIPSAFSKGQIAMYLKGTWYESFLTGAGMKPDEDFGMFVLPGVKPEVGKVVISEVTPLLVAQNSKNRDNAIKAVVALTKKDANQKLLSLYGGLPIRKDVVSSDPVIKKLADEVASNNYKNYTRFWEATPSELSEYASSEFERFMLKPDTYMQVLDNIQKKADKYWSEHK
jgi:multiple sugar transport system substrate-binding protein